MNNFAQPLCLLLLKLCIAGREDSRLLVVQKRFLHAPQVFQLDGAGEKEVGGWRESAALLRPIEIR